MVVTLTESPRMTITLGITIAIIAGAVGFMLGAAVMVKTPEPARPPQPLPTHEHLWGEWEQAPEPTRITQDGAWVADEYLQHRQCATCGWVEHHATRI